MRAAVSALRSEVREEGAVVLRRLDQALQAGVGAGDERDLAYAALALQRAYTGFEAVLERCVRFFDSDVPAGADSHRALLARAALAVEAVRPALVSPDTLASGRELLRFLHFLRHDYGAELAAEPMLTLLRRAQAFRTSFAADLQALDGWLADLAVR